MEVTGRIYDRLKDCFGPQSVFRDIDSLPLGMPFPELLVATLSRTDLVLVIIGPTWTTIADEQGQRRLTKEVDYVRLEVETALETELPVIPVLASNADLPSAAELPESIRLLTERTAYQVRPDPDFHRDVDGLCTRIQEVLGLPSNAVRKSEAVDEKLEQLEGENTRLRESLATQQAIVELDREWELTRRKSLFQGMEPKPWHAALGAFGGLWIAGFGLVGVVAVVKVDAHFSIALVPLALLLSGTGWPVYLFVKYARFDDARSKYRQRRRELQQFAEELANGRT